jgi:hypothetical protein
LLIVIVSTISCSRNKNETINKFILYGYSGFVFIDSSIYIFDSTKLNIIQYFEYTRDSSIKIAHGRYKTKYYRMNPIKLVGFENSLNSLLNNEFNKEYLPERVVSMYDGWYYSIYYMTSSQREVLINYIPNELPDSLKILHDYILNYIDNASIIDNEFDFNKIVRVDALNLFNKYPPPPPPSMHIEEIKLTKP